MANQALPDPDEPHLRLWQALTAMRETEATATSIASLTPTFRRQEALVLQAATGRSPEDGLRVNRGWSADEWSAAATSLAARGLVDDEMRITVAGSELEAGNRGRHRSAGCSDYGCHR